MKTVGEGPTSLQILFYVTYAIQIFLSSPFEGGAE